MASSVQNASVPSARPWNVMTRLQVPSPVDLDQGLEDGAGPIDVGDVADAMARLEHADEGLVGRNRQVHRVAIEHLRGLVERVPEGRGAHGGGGCRSRGGGRVVEPTLEVGVLEGGVGLGDQRGAVGVTARSIGVGGGDLGPVGHAHLGPGRRGSQAERGSGGGDLHRQSAGARNAVIAAV